MEKQIIKAQNIIKAPSKSTKTKFVEAQNETLKLKEELIVKATKLFGVKGYYTDLDDQKLSTSKVIERDQELYKVEQAFRIAKSDLETRPFSHFNPN